MGRIYFPSPHSVPNASKVHLALEEISIANGTIQIRGNGGAQTNYTLSSIQTGFSGWAGSVASLCYEVFTPGVEETITDGKVVKTSSAGKLDVSLIPAIGNEFDFTATGSLTSSSTAYVCDKMGEYPQDISALKNVSGQGWTPVDVTDIVWVTADDNKYLRGDIDALNPSGSETIKIRVR